MMMLHLKTLTNKRVLLQSRHFSTSQACSFTSDFPSLTSQVDTYSRTVYNHLQRIHEKDQVKQQRFMSLTESTDEKSQSEMQQLRKEMA